MCLVFTRMPGESCRRRLRSLLLYSSCVTLFEHQLTPLSVDFVSALRKICVYSFEVLRLESTERRKHAGRQHSGASAPGKIVGFVCATA